IALPEKKPAQSESNRQDGVDGEVRAAMQLIVDGPDPHGDESYSDSDIEPRQRVSLESENGRDKEDNRESCGHDPRNLPIETGRERMKTYRNPKERQQSQAL